MSSVLRFIAQPKTRTFAVTQDGNNYLFTQSNFDTWLEANAGKIEVLSDDLFIIPGTSSGSTFEDVLTGGGDATELEYTNLDSIQRKTVVDLGKQIVIGNAVNSRILVFRLVQQYL